MELRAAIKRLPFAPSAYALVRLLGGRKARFATDYSRNSGVGSDLNATKTITSTLRDLLNSISVKTMLDIPCGDFLWMQKVDLQGVSYIGADIIESLITSHKSVHASPEKTFRTLDLITDDLPEVDLIFCRDCLVHFSHRLVKKAVSNVRRSGSRYLLTTTFPEHSKNKGIVTGNWQPLNLCAPPFKFPPPLRIINEGTPEPYQDKSLALWRIRELPTL